MKKFVIATIACVVLMWATMASAQDYAALGDDTYGPYLGVGGLLIFGDDNATPPNNGSEFLPTINLVGLTDTLAYQIFYGFGSESSAWGGNLDYILADNFDECFTCPDQGMWWFGIGPSYISVEDLYFDEADQTAALSDNFFGGNLGFGYIWDKWHVNLYAHYLDGQVAVQGMLMYDLSGS